MSERTLLATRRYCRLCAEPGEFGPFVPGEPYTGLCPGCVTAGRPTRAGLERAVVIVARQNLAAVESVVLPLATPDELTYYVCTLKRSLCSLLQLFARVGGEGR
ncbi:hypothetical protein [Streptomyces sp. SBT349]|uniref:hypothetical protein n=1 Tax=Streptomyces sp. SBT349 TaxID=1580539 RepID=UPI00066EC7CA|nr:hypothetical protein [Streptomyces sp. SBT349]